MKSETLSWLRMQQVFGPGSGKPASLLHIFGSASSFFCAGEREWKLSGVLTERDLQSVKNTGENDALLLWDRCKKAEQHVVTMQDEEYPALLREIDNPPCVLYVKGVLPDFAQRPSVSIVGTRNASTGGSSVTERIAFDLAKAGMVVVSGGAMGIDSAAHRGAIRAGGVTVCVLGCGIDFHYLMANAGLREAIAKNGAVISEFPPGSSAHPSHFPIRNRIISGLTLGTLVVEAAEKSGSLITVNDALRQNRDVFAVPCSVASPVSKGVNGLLKQGAKPVTCAQDIMEEYEFRFPGLARAACSDSEDTMQTVCTEHNSDAAAKNARFALLSENAKKVAEALSDSPRDSSALVRATGMHPAALLAALTELELEGFAHSCSGQRYVLV